MNGNRHDSSFVEQKSKMVKSTIAILGATEVSGAAVAKSLAKDRFRLLLFGHDDTQLAALFDEIKILNPRADIDCLHCVVDASWEADLIISAVPTGSERELAEKIREVCTQKILLIVSAKQEGLGGEPSRDKSSVEEIQQLLPDSKVVQTFSIEFAADFARAVAGGHSLDAFFMNNDLQALQQ